MATAEETAIINLTATNADLVATVTTLAGSVSSTIAAAVVVSENAAQVPLAQMLVAHVDTNTAFLSYINGVSA